MVKSEVCCIKLPAHEYASPPYYPMSFMSNNVHWCYQQGQGELHNKLEEAGIQIFDI